jgi:hypothetical protein
LKLQYVRIPVLDDTNNVDLTKLVKDPPKEPVSVSDATLDVPKYTQRQVEELLAGRSAVTSGAGASGGLSGAGAKLASVFGNSSAESTVACVRELMRELLNIDGNPTNDKGEKALLPINFLSCIRGTQDAEDIVHSAKGMIELFEGRR